MRTKEFSTLQPKDAAKAGDLLQGAFAWAESKEGHRYWDTVRSRLCEISKQEDRDKPKPIEKSTDPKIPSYVGKFVLVDFGGSYPAPTEYLIVRETPHTLYGVGTGGGYSSHELKAIRLVAAGTEKPVTIVSVRENTEAARKLATDLEWFANTKKRGEKGNWVESVYEGAGNTARMVRETLPTKQFEFPRYPIYPGITFAARY